MKRELKIEDKITIKKERIKALSTKIKAYTQLTWVLVVLGALAFIFGMSHFQMGKAETFYNYNLIGDFYSGTVGSIWSLAGLFLIYVAFLGQKQQLLYQEIELLYNQEELKLTRLEFKTNRITNIGFKTIENLNNEIKNISFLTYANEIEERQTYGWSKSITIKEFITIFDSKHFNFRLFFSFRQIDCPESHDFIRFIKLSCLSSSITLLERINSYLINFETLLIKDNLNIEDYQNINSLIAISIDNDIIQLIKRLERMKDISILFLDNEEFSTLFKKIDQFKKLISKS